MTAHGHGNRTEKNATASAASRKISQQLSSALSALQGLASMNCPTDLVLPHPWSKHQAQPLPGDDVQSVHKCLERGRGYFDLQWPQVPCHLLQQQGVAHPHATEYHYMHWYLVDTSAPHCNWKCTDAHLCVSRLGNLPHLTSCTLGNYFTVPQPCVHPHSHTSPTCQATAGCQTSA